MIYVALLRGINIGGRNKVNMKELKNTFENAGMESVVTYINSGNVIFKDDEQTQEEITARLEAAIFEDFSLPIKVLIRDFDVFTVLMEAMPAEWKNDKEMKSDVLFLWEDLTCDSVTEELVVKPQIDKVITVPGAVLWCVDKSDVTKSGLMRLASKKIYKKITIRNVNSVRKIYYLMEALHIAEQHD